MALFIPTKTDELKLWCREIVDECMASATERGMVYTRAAQYFYQGSYDSRAAIFNKCNGFVKKLAGYLMQPDNVRFNLVYNDSETENILERAQLASQILSADYRQSDSDLVFAGAVIWSLINGCSILKHRPIGQGFQINPVHPQNFGVLSETICGIEEQEALCHVSYPTLSRLRAMLEEWGVPNVGELMRHIMEAGTKDRDEEQDSYFHQIVVGGLQPLGNIGEAPSAAGIVNVFPVPTPWKPNKQISRTVKFCELWIKDIEREGDYTTLQFIYPDVIIQGKHERQNLSKIPGRSSFIKVQAEETPGYFWGRSVIADIQMLQDLVNKRLRDIKILWDRNVNSPKAMSGFTSVTEEMYFKIISEGGFLADPNPNAKVQDLSEPPQQGYLEELQFIWQMFDEAAGFSPILSGQGESSVRAGVHAQTLVRTSSPRLIDQAARIERQLAESGYLAFRLMQAMDATIYRTDDNGIEFRLAQMPDGFQVEVDSHSASPAFAEDNRQIAVALARAGAVDAEDLIHMLHPPGAELLLSRLRQRKKAQAEAAQQEKQEQLMRDVIGLPEHRQQSGQAGRRRG